MSMKVPVNTMTQNELNAYLERVVKSAFMEGVLWMKCGGRETEFYGGCNCQRTEQHHL